MAKFLLALGLGLALSACGGGGGGNVRNDPPTSPPPTTPPPPPPPPPPAPSGTGLHLSLTNATAAHNAGYTGQGIRIGVVDSGVNRNHPALAGRVIRNFTYINPNANNLSVDDVVGHGTWVSQILAGQSFGNWRGGVAPGAQIVSARIISDRRPDDDGTGQGNEVDGALGLLPIHQDLIAAGARIMNNSWGGLYWTNPAATAPIADEYRSFIFANDGLVVFATGNSSFANPSDMAALPSQAGVGGSRPAADLERGWLAVAAVDSNRQLASYSNACGIAMRYCLVAPGSVIVTDHNSTASNVTYGTVSGTSLAAPQVSGAAALVWEAFPYFNNDLVRQTLLGTASDLGDPGVDAVYGYGLLNVGQAVKGPAKFDWGDVDVSFNGATSTWSNAISGSGGLIKRGTGTLVLDSSSTYTGQTQVLEGELRIPGNQSLVSDVTIGPGGTLSGYARVGALLNNGTLRLDQPAFNVTRDYRQGSQGRLAVLLSSPLYVGGTAHLDGELHVLGVKPGYVTSSREQILSANAIDGQFARLTTAANVFLTGSLSYAATTVWLDIARLDVTAAARAMGNATPASLASAARVEHAFRGIDAQRHSGAGGRIDERFIALAGDFQRAPTAEQGAASLASLSGELHAAADAMTFDAVGMQRRALSARFGERVGQPARQGAWYRPLGQPGSGSLGTPGFDVDGWSLGEESRWGERGVAGVAFGELRAQGQRGNGHDRSRDRQTQGQFYLGRMQDRSYLLGQAGFGRYDRRMERSLLLGERHRGTVTEYAGDLAFASAEAGYRWDWGRTTLGAYAGGEHVRIHREGFSEAGADGFGLTARASRGERTQAILGWRAERAWHGAGGRRFTLRGYGEWQRTLDHDGLVFDASFVGAHAWSPLVGGDVSRSGGGVGLGFDVELGERSLFSFGHDRRWGARNGESAASLRLAVGF